MSNSVSSNKEALARLKPVQPKVVWGSNRSNLLALSDHEYVMPVGCGVLHFDNASLITRRAKMVTTTYPEVEKVLMMCLSKDGNYISTSVAMKNQQRNDIHLVIFYTKGHLDNSLRPRHIKYSASGFVPVGDQLQITCMDFSHDSTYLACSTNFTSIGTLVFDHLKGTIFQTIISDVVPKSLSFHPTDNGKMIVTGANNFIKFWRFTSKSVHVAPVIGLRRGNFAYSQHAWLQPYTESVVVVGSESGFLSILQNCEQRAPSHQAFGSSEYSDPIFNGVAHLLVRGDNVLAASGKNQLVLYEVRRVVLSKGIAGLTATLFPLAYYRLDNVDSLYGLDFTLKSSVTSYSLIAATDSNVVVLDMISDHDLSGGNELKQKRDEEDEDDHTLWTNISIDHRLFGYHSGSIQSMSVSSKGHVFMTSSFHDGTVRMWDFDDPSTFKSAWLIESFSERPEENPFYTDLHPLGLQVAAASESEVREYAVADSQLDLVRKFGVRAPFQSSNGQPVVISQPVSLVKYSNGGHLLAVVTGKIVQIFHMLMDDLDGHSPGSPCRVMALCDHVSTVTDLAFMRDDNRIVTVSSDGCVYSWRMGGIGREKEYIYKGIAATRVAVSTHHLDKCMIAVCFEGTAVETVQTLAADVVKRRRQTSIAVRSSSSKQSLEGFPVLSSQSSARMTPMTPTGIDILPMSPGNTFDKVGAFANETTNSFQVASSTGPKNYFVALWENEISANPVIAYCDVPIKSVALGRLSSPDSVDVCVLGLGDGRVLISTFPIPLLYINPVSVSTTISNSKPQLFHSGSIRLGGKKRKPGALSMESVKENINETSVSTEMLNPAQKSVTDSVGEESSGNFSPNRGVEGTVVQSNNLEKKQTYCAMIDENNCKVFRLFVGATTHVSFSQEGEWIFTAGEDNSIHLISTAKNISEEAAQKQQLLDISTAAQQFLMMDKAKMQHLRSKLIDLEYSVEQNRKDNEMYLTKVLEGKEKQMQELESKLNKEVQKRDENIIAGRKEYLHMKRSMQDEIVSLKQRSDEALSAMELMYEKKLAQEAVYLDKMKQAYDEFVVHSRMDMTNLQQQVDTKIQVIEQDKIKSLLEAEKQKVAVLQYYEYVKQRNDEVLQTLEEQQAEER
jgi:WD40 repeat protein